MKLRVTPLFVSAFCFAVSVQASLDEILAPLPEIDEAELESEEVSASASTTDNNNSSSQDRSKGTQLAESLPAAIVEKAFVPTRKPITEAVLLKAIEEEVDALLKPAGQISLSPMRQLPKLSQYDQPFNVVVSRLPGRLSGKSIQLSVQVQNAEGVLGNWDIPFRPHLYSDVWFTMAPLRKGDLAKVSDLEARQVDLLSEPDAVVARLEVLQRHEYRNDLRPGQPLEWTDLVERSLVRKGEIVDVIAYQGMIGITMRAKVQENGVRGDMVFLRNLESNKEFAGEVIDEGRVQVTF